MTCHVLEFWIICQRVDLDSDMLQIQKNFIEKFTSSFILSSQLGPSQQQKTPTIIVGEIVYADILCHLYYY